MRCAIKFKAAGNHLLNIVIINFHSLNKRQNSKYILFMYVKHYCKNEFKAKLL